MHSYFIYVYSICHPYVTLTYSHVICMLLVCTHMSSVCTRMSSVFHSYVLVCYPYYSSVIRQKGNLKMGISRKESTSDFPKTNISYPLILPTKGGWENKIWRYIKLKSLSFITNLHQYLQEDKPKSIKESWQIPYRWKNN